MCLGSYLTVEVLITGRHAYAFIGVGFMRKIALFSLLILAAFSVSAGAATATTAARAGVHVNPRGGLDCNGFSPLQKSFRYMLCT